MPVDPPHDRRSPRSTWSRRAAQGSAAALAALTALGTVGSAHAAPAPAPNVHVAQHAQSTHVTVAPGDSLWSLATAHGVRVQDLMSVNKLPAHGMIRPGQRLVIPGSDRAPASSSAAASRADDADPVGSDRGGSRRHTVAAGDTLWDLAQRYGVSVAELMRANGVSAASVLRPGQGLTIPGGAAGPARAASSSEPAATVRDAGTAAAPKPKAAVGDTFAGRTYPREVVESANRHHAQLQQRQLPAPEQIREMVRATAQELGVDPALALAHASQESGFRHGVVSPADAVGTMQVIPSAGEWASAMVGRDLDLLDPQDNITAGVALIRELQAKAPNKAAGIGAYYQGLHGVKTYGMYPDTKAYVKAVSAQEREFAQ
ncbi:lytic transglycosylase [Kocuria marina]|uniref:lytic transglycosylase n=1 Tax=Kocuria marina TaxID=223184 RepID=UPI000BF2046B